MAHEMPECYKEGLAYVNSLNQEAMIAWLRSELNEKTAPKRLAGGHDDYPVQAIVNHYPYFSADSQKFFGYAVHMLVLDWITDGTQGFGEDGIRALMSLVGELKIVRVRLALMGFIFGEEKNTPSETMLAPLLRAFASISTTDDLEAWEEIAETHPKFGGMAFQAILQCASREDAIRLLPRINLQDEHVQGSVERAMPDYRKHLQA